MIKRSLLSISLLLISLVIFSQADKEIKMADEMRSNGKIYVVVAVILAIFAGIVLYLIRLDRKMSRLEKETKSINH